MTDITILRGVAGNILRGEVDNHKSQNELHSFNRGWENRKPESIWTICDKLVGRRAVGPMWGWKKDWENAVWPKRDDDFDDDNWFCSNSLK